MGMPSDAAPERDAPGPAERYEVRGMLGSGGMATVCQAYDTLMGREVALKRLRPSSKAERGQQALRLFEREYHTLSQLAHPRVVEVFDFGVDDLGAYYTMELLDGGDLEAKAPADWRQACAWMRDVCSVLALLHSRQLVHRDVSARNIRCTQQGVAKLLDFGAMSPMGLAKEVVGTPVICPPEVLYRERLDARTDLYELGCTLYFALTGRYPYAATSFARLPLLWANRPPRPSDCVPALPAELDALVMSLIHTEAAKRPASAAEVMEQLTAIAGLPQNEQLPVSHAYLVSPTLVGRDRVLAKVRARRDAMLEGRGAGVLVVGAHGQGRSRVLDTAMLEAKLSGALVLRADATDSQDDPWGGVVAIGKQLLRLHPDVARSAAQAHAEALGALFPELLPKGAEEAPRPSSPQATRTLQAALIAWLVEVSKAKPLAIGVDDIDAIDEPTQSLTALLVGDASAHRILVVATGGSEVKRATAGALHMLVTTSRTLALHPLDESEVEALLRSLFGDAQNVQQLAHLLHRRSLGNPRDVMDLAQHLVERGAIRYGFGAWTLPFQVHANDLPASMTDALRSKRDSLTAESLQLARAMALAPDSPTDLDGLRSMTEHQDPSRTVRALDALLATGVARGVGDRFELTRQAWAEVLLEGLPPQAQGELHALLVARFEMEGDDFRVARHLLHAGELDRGLDVLVRHAERSLAETDVDPGAYMRLMRSLPEDWKATYDLSFELCRERGRGKRDQYLLNLRAASMMARGIQNPNAVRVAATLLVEATGLDLFASVDPALPYQERIKKTFELAHQRYLSQPEKDRVLPPTEALKPLGNAYIIAIGSVATRLDLELWKDLPSLAPFAPLAPGLALVEHLREGVGARVSGRVDAAAEAYRATLDRLNQPDRAGLDPTFHRYTLDGVICGLGLISAPLGSEEALQLVEGLHDGSTYEVNAEYVRMVYHLWQGDAEAAERCRRQAERLRVQFGGREVYQMGGHLVAEVVAYGCTDDVISLKQIFQSIERLVESMPRWRPVLAFASGEYHRIRRNLDAALVEFERASEDVATGEHPLFCEIAGGRARTLCELGRFAEARDVALHALEVAERAGLDHASHFVRMPLALACGALGEHDRARTLAKEIHQTLQARQAGTLVRGMALEVCARVALLAKDQAAFDELSEACRELYSAHGHRGLLAKYERLLSAAEQAGLCTPRERTAAADPSDGDEVHLSDVLSECDSPEARAEQALQLLVTTSGAIGGTLFRVSSEGPEQVAAVGAETNSLSLTPLARGTLLEEYESRLQAAATQTGDIDAESAGVQPPGLHQVFVQHAEGERLRITGLAFLRMPKGSPFQPPVQLASQLSRYWYDSGESKALGERTPWTCSQDA